MTFLSRKTEIVFSCKAFLKNHNFEKSFLQSSSSQLRSLKYENDFYSFRVVIAEVRWS